MSITELLQNSIYPALYESIDTVLPEFKFKPSRKGYVSTSNIKIDGSAGESGKVYIYDNNIGRLIDYTRSSISIWDYIMQRDGLSEREALQRLSELSGVRLPSKELTEEEITRIKEQRRRAQIWEDLNNYLLDCLSNPNNAIAQSPEAAVVRDYLVKSRSEGGRGYQRTDLRLFIQDYDREASYIEAGFMPDPIEAYRHLQAKGYGDAELRSTLRLTEDGRIGRQGYFLTLPYRDKAGAIKGLVIRNIHYQASRKDQTPKYLYTKSLDGIRGKLLFNLKPLTGAKDLIIVESQFDAQLASVRGLVNVVAMGSKSLTIDQVREALRSKPQSITLLLDNETETAPQIKAAIDLILQEDETTALFVASIPQPHIKDLEEYLIAYPVEQFRSEVMAQRLPYWKYLLLSTIKEHIAKVGDRDITDEEEEFFRRDIIKQGNKIALPMHQDLYFKEFVQRTSAAGFELTPEVLQATAERIKYSEDKEQQAKEFKKLLAQAQDLQNKGDIGRALELITERAKDIRAKDKANEFAQLTVPVDEDQVRERLLNKADKLKSGFYIQGSELLIPSGAISIIAAPTSHGKTTFLINLGLNLTKSYPGKKIHLFSYEEDADSVLVSALNSFVGEELNESKRRDSNRDLIRDYLKDGSVQYVKGSKVDTLRNKKESFFKGLIATQRLNIHYVDYNADTLIDAIYYLHKQGDVGAILIDYIQLLHKGERGNNKYGNRQEELKQICLDLKDVSVQTGLPIILGAQFNREVTNHLLLHSTKISEAGDIERVANLILGFWNNDFEPLNPSNSEQNMIKGRGMDTPNTLYTKILKYRGGRPGLSDNLSYNGNAGTIGNPVSTQLDAF